MGSEYEACLTKYVTHETSEAINLVASPNVPVPKELFGNERIARSIDTFEDWLRMIGVIRVEGYVDVLRRAGYPHITQVEMLGIRIEPILVTCVGSRDFAPWCGRVYTNRYRKQAIMMGFSDLTDSVFMRMKLGC